MHPITPVPLPDHPRPQPAAPPRLLGVMLALLALVLPLLAMPAALAESPRSVTVLDTADVLNDGPVAQRLKELDFRHPVDLVVLTVDVREQGQDPTSDIALNDATLHYARSEHPDWVTSGGKWRDGLVVIALDPRNRMIGTSAGEDVKLSESDRSEIEKAMRTPARDGAWDDAVVDGADTYAELLGRPWYQRPGSIIIALAAVVGAIAAVFAIIGGALARRSRSRRLVDEAMPRYDDVMLQYETTELAARTIPRESRYGEPVLRDYEAFTRTAAEATRLREQLPAHRGTWWGIRAADARLARDFSQATQKIDAMDDEIVATNDLLSRSSRWQDAWEQELVPVRESLEAVDTAVHSTPELADSPTAADLRSVASKVEAGITRTTQALTEGTMSGDDALAELDRMTEALGRAATAHRDAVIAHSARSEEEARVMREAGSASREDARYGSIRGRRRHYYPDAYAGAWSLSPVLWLSSWNHSASSDLDTYRNPPSVDTSSHTGFSSSSSGGFSGASSSGRF